MTRRKNKALNEYEQELLSGLISGGSVEDVLKPLMKRLIDASLSAELGAHLESAGDSEAVDDDASDYSGRRFQARNRRNGYGSKRVRTSIGEVEIDTPRDRDSSF